jgi:hypothetical protein
MVKFLLFGLLLFAIGQPGLAQESQSTCVQVNYSFPCKRSKPSDVEMTNALALAKSQILNAYVEKTEGPRQQLLEGIRDKINAATDALVSGVSLVAQDYDKPNKTLTLSVIGTVNVSAIDLLLPHTTTSKNYISLIFVARRQITVKSIGPEAVIGTSKVDSTTQVASQNSGESAVGNAITLKTDSAVISRSATTQTSDRISYDVSTGDSLDTAMESVLTDRNFKVVPSATVRHRSNGAFAVEKFIESFKAGNDVDPELIQNAADACSKMSPKLPFYGYGTLTISPPQTDPVSGRTRVNVQVYAKVIDCRGDFATTAASIEAIQYSGLGESSTEAETVAETRAAKEAARLIADKLNAKGIY